VLRAASPAEPLRTLIVGDSTAFVMGHAVIRSNIEGLLGPEVLFKTSSSLVRPDFFDWPFFLGWVVDNDPPEVMLLSLGANDHQPVTTPDGRVLDVHEEGWRAEYLRRVQELSTRITDAGTRLYWIGQPLARSAGYSAAMAKINGVFREVADQDEDVVFLDIWSRLSTPDGAYTDTVPGPDGQPVQIRQADGIHLTDAGGDVAAPLIWESLRIDWGG
jgi:hypothetical protein